MLQTLVKNDCGGCHKIKHKPAVGFSSPEWSSHDLQMELFFHRKQLVTNPSSQAKPSTHLAVYATPRLMGASFLWRNASTWGQILLVSVPENVWSTPLHLEEETEHRHWFKGWFIQKKPYDLTDYINRRCILPDRTGRTPRPAPSEFHRISASVWLCLESHHPSAPEAPRWHHPSPAENARFSRLYFRGFEPLCCSDKRGGGVLTGTLGGLKSVL